MVRTMLIEAKLPKIFWGKAMLTAMYILNRVPCKAVPDTPYERWNGRKPDLMHIKRWGTVAHVKITDPNQDKLDSRSVKCIFIGYPKGSKGYRLYNPLIGLIESRDVEFLEYCENNDIIQSDNEPTEYDDILFDNEIIGKEPIYTQSGNEPADEQIDSGSQNMSETPERNLPHTLIGYKRSRAPPSHLSDYYLYLSEGSEHQENSSVLLENLSFDEAVSSSESVEWISAMNEEIESIQRNQVWELVDLPPGRKPIGCKWVLKKKLKSDGTIEKFKARLVAKGFSQKAGIDYEETYYPVAKFTSIRIILAIAAFYDLDIWQMDVKTAFLNGDLNETIFMTQPKGFISQDSNKVCRLKKSLYGLKQSPRQWYFAFHKAIIKLGYSPNQLDQCVYMWNSGSNFCLLSLYVDDILLTRNDTEMITNTKKWLNKNFEMKDMGEASYILGIKISRDRNARTLRLSQENYIDQILRKFGMADCKPVNTPIAKGTILSKDDCPAKGKMLNIPYAQAVGSLMYLMLGTRPDISFAIGLVSRYQSNPDWHHWQVVKRIFRYLKGTRDLSLTFGGGSLELVGYSDADFAGCKDDSKSTSGFVFTFGGGVVAWSCKKQGCVAQHTQEAEFIACNIAATFAVWMNKFLKELKLNLGKEPIQLFCDNQTAISLMKNGSVSSRSKHIMVKYHYVHELIEKNEITVDFIPSPEMLADPMTKALTENLFVKHVAAMGLKYL
ncbi:unnamed protein product [Victoria cruziana]